MFLCCTALRYSGYVSSVVSKGRIILSYPCPPNKDPGAALHKHFAIHGTLSNTSQQLPKTIIVSISNLKLEEIRLGFVKIIELITQELSLIRSYLALQ